MNFNKIFHGKKIMVTGHTGFKGSWLSIWLQSLGAEVYGLSLDVPTDPSHHQAARMNDLMREQFIDIRDADAVARSIQDIRPDIVFHLAAQALVRRAYDDPVSTYQTNVIGTLNILEGLRRIDHPCVAVLITSDKCYDNVEWVWGYRETDALGGPDPYSASKGAAELVIRSHVRSFLPKDGSLRLGVARAGNVIGGGDWALDRIVPDCVRAWAQGQSVSLRNPYSTRPWQNVLEPLSGYLALAAHLAIEPELHGEAFNFGPSAGQDHTVLDLVKQTSCYWNQVKWEDVSGQDCGLHESGLLKLNCDKALHFLQWQAVLDFEQTAEMTANWYRRYYEKPEKTILEVTREQINKYITIAKQKGLAWAAD